MKNKRVFLVAITAAIGFAGIAANSGLKLDAWPFSAPVVEQESSVIDAKQGNIIFDHTSGTDGEFKGYNGSAWINFGGGSGSIVPAGTILPFAGTSAPSGYLIADGSPVSRTTYASLFAVIGESFGAGDGVNTFNLPDLRGRFLRGVDDGAGRDPNAGTRTAMAAGGNTGDSVGSVQADAFQGHWHTYQYSSGVRGTSSPSGVVDQIAGGISASTANRVIDAISDGVNGTPRTSSETRPTNAYVNYIIKY